MIDLDAAIHDNLQPLVPGKLRGLLIDDPLLHPDRFGQRVKLQHLLDEMPPEDATWSNYPYYDTSWFDSFGRSYFLQVTYKFGGKPLD